MKILDANLTKAHLKAGLHLEQREQIVYLIGGREEREFLPACNLVDILNAADEELKWLQSFEL